MWLSSSLISHSGPPEILISPAMDTVVSGCQTFFATCVAVGTELDTIIFTRDGVALPADNCTVFTVEVVEDVTTSTVTASLELCTVTLADAGVYGCVAMTAAGSDEATFNITVPNEMGEFVAIFLFNCEHIMLVTKRVQLSGVPVYGDNLKASVYQTHKYSSCLFGVGGVYVANRGRSTRGFCTPLDTSLLEVHHPSPRTEGSSSSELASDSAAKFINIAWIFYPDDLDLDFTHPYSA